MYKRWQPLYDELRLHIPKVQFIQNLPSEMNDDAFFNIKERTFVIIDDMMKAATEMQQKMSALQEELHAMTVQGESGAGLVKAVCSCKGELKSLDIDPSIFNPDDKEVVEDLILAAVKDAQTKAAEKAQQEMARLTESMGLPKDVKLPF